MKFSAFFGFCFNFDRYLLNENYYWLFKKFVIFDIDRQLNIHLIFMNVAEVAKEYGITRNRLNAILSENKPVEKFRIDQDANLQILQEEFDQFVKQDLGEDEDKLEFTYDLSKFKTMQKQQTPAEEGILL